MKLKLSTPPPHSSISRRQFMKIGAAAALALAVTRSIDRKVFAQAVASAPSFQKITARDAGVIAAIAPVVLAGNLPLDFASRQAAIAEVVAAFDRTVAGLPTAMQAEVDEFLGFPRVGVTRRFIAGIAKPWPK